jgi:hypothetical protein
MTVTYKADANDMLLYQLYVASKSKRITDKRRKARYNIAISFLVLGPLLLLNGHVYFGVLIIAAAIGWYFIYPVWEAGYYRRHYEGFIAETWGGKDYTGTEVQLNSDSILTKEDGTESHIATSGLEAVTETGQAVYVRLKTGISIIFPKNKIDRINELIALLQQLCTQLHIPYTTELDWVWK